jgi:hypothetical protein
MRETAQNHNDDDRVVVAREEEGDRCITQDLDRKSEILTQL